MSSEVAVKKKTKPRPLWLRILKYTLTAIVVLPAFAFCSFILIFLIYHIGAEPTTKSMLPPEYPNAVLLYSGNNYAGNCCIEKIWNYCTIDIQSEVVHFYEPYFGEFRQLEYQHRQSNNDIVAYHAGIPNKNLVIGVSSSIIGFRKPTLGISILNYHVSCPDGTWYQISINYESV